MELYVVCYWHQLDYQDEPEYHDREDGVICVYTTLKAAERVAATYSPSPSGRRAYVIRHDRATFPKYHLVPAC